MSRYPKQRTRLVKLVGVVSDFLDGKASSTGTGKYKVRSTGGELGELYAGGTCIAMWQRTEQGSHRVLVDRKKGSRTANQCIDLLGYMALRRGIPTLTCG